MDGEAPQADLIAQYFQHAIATFQPLSREGCSHQQQSQEPLSTPQHQQQQQRSHRRSQHSGHAQSRGLAGTHFRGITINIAQAPCAPTPGLTLNTTTSKSWMQQGGGPPSMQPTPPSQDQAIQQPTQQHQQPQGSGAGVVSQPPRWKEAASVQGQQRVHEPCSRTFLQRTRRRVPPPPPPPPPPFLPNINALFPQQWSPTIWWPPMHAYC